MKRSSTILGILAAALLLAVASFAGIKPSNNATRQEVESDTTLAVKGVLDIESGGSLKFNGTAFSASDYVPVTKAGQQTLTATGAGNDITLTANDKVILNAGSSAGSYVGLYGKSLDGAFGSGGVNLLVDDGAGSTAQAYATPDEIGFDIDGATDEFYLSATAFQLNLGGTSTEVSVSADSTTISGAFRLTPSAAPPVACAGGAEGTLYLDSDTHLLCVCNGTGYVQVADGSTACS